jgi:hypothetical protein
MALILETNNKAKKAKPAPAPAPEPTVGDERLEEQRQIAAAKAGLESLGGDRGDEDEFEASADELQKQILRPAPEGEAV